MIWILCQMIIQKERQEIGKVILPPNATLSLITRHTNKPTQGTLYQAELDALKMSKVLTLKDWGTLPDGWRQMRHEDYDKLPQRTRFRT